MCTTCSMHYVYIKDGNKWWRQNRSLNLEGGSALFLSLTLDQTPHYACCRQFTMSSHTTSLFLPPAPVFTFLAHFTRWYPIFFTWVEAEEDKGQRLLLKDSTHEVDFSDNFLYFTTATFFSMSKILCFHSKRM